MRFAGLRVGRVQPLGRGPLSECRSYLVKCLAIQFSLLQTTGREQRQKGEGDRGSTIIH